MATDLNNHCYRYSSIVSSCRDSRHDDERFHTLVKYNNSPGLQRSTKINCDDFLRFLDLFDDSETIFNSLFFLNPGLPTPLEIRKWLMSANRHHLMSPQLPRFNRSSPTRTCSISSPQTNDQYRQVFHRSLQRNGGERNRSTTDTRMTLCI